MNRAVVFSPLMLIIGLWSTSTRGDAVTRPVQHMRALRLPGDQVSVTHDGVELTRLNFGPRLPRPYLLPVVGPSGNSLTRRAGDGGHPHHNSIWLAHPRVNGVDFWTNAGTGRQVLKEVEKLTDGEDAASIATLIHWVNSAKYQTLLIERRRYTFEWLEKGEWLVLIDSQLEAATDATLGWAQHGLLGVRMREAFNAESGGTYRTSEGATAANTVLKKTGKWVDITGRATSDAKALLEGIAIFDHPKNPNYPGIAKVYNGWMSTSSFGGGAIELPKGKTLRLRYGVYVHGDQSADAISARWDAFAKKQLDEGQPPATATQPAATLKEKP